MSIVYMTITIAIAGLVGLWMVLETLRTLQPRTDRWQEMQRAITLVETRMKLIEQTQQAHSDAIAEHYARFDVSKGQYWAPLRSLEELRDEISRNRYVHTSRIEELDSQTKTNVAAIEVMQEQFAKRILEIREESSKLSSMIGSIRPGMRTG